MTDLDIDPLTGSPIIVKSDEPQKSDEPVSHDGLVSLTDADVKDSREPTQNNPSTVIGEVPSVPQSRKEFMVKVADVLKRYTSDSQSYKKALSEIDDLVPSN